MCILHLDIDFSDRYCSESTLRIRFNPASSL